MDFILNEAFEDDLLSFQTRPLKKCILKTNQILLSRTMMRGIDNKNERVKFFNQDLEANPENFDEDYFEEDEHPELFNPENNKEI